jgi:hypothetical protein
VLVQPIGVSHLQKLENGYGTTFKNYYLNDGKSNAVEQNRKIDEFLNDKFHEIVKKGEEWKYNATIAITKIFMTGPFMGLLYPSISAKMKGANFVFKPKFADQNFRIVNGRMYKITEATPEYILLLTIKVLDTVEGSNEDYRNAKIAWRDILPTDQEIEFKIEL